MTAPTDLPILDAAPAPAPAPAAAQRPRRPWFGLALAGALWLQSLVGWLLDVQSFAWFLSTMALYAAVTIAFFAWWLSRRSFTWTERLAAFVAAPLLGVVVGRLSLTTIRPVFYMILFGLPIVLMAWAVWAFVTAPHRGRARLVSLLGCFAVIWGSFLLIRVNGSQGNMRGDVHLRWTPTAEEIYLANRRAAPPAVPLAPTTARAIALQPGDWPNFRGPDRDGAVHGLRVALDWNAAPPKVLWRQRVGPAWSSMAVVDGRVFTQEQRGDREAVVCRDAATGSELWSHEDPARFDEPMSGPGPRATPTFANGRLYTQGARGALDCFDAATGRLIWSRNVATDAGASVPIFGYSGSPLVTASHVIAFAGGEAKKGLLAYPLDGGAPAWTADAGKVSYSSPQCFTFGDEQPQVLIFTAEGLFAVDESTGQSRWEHAFPTAVGVPPAIQPCRVGPDSVLLGYGAGFGAASVRVAPDHRSAARQWVTLKMKPSFNDMVYYQGCVYGFDGTVFCCLDAATGQRHWRDGRYGGGQVLLLADQGVMIVASEDGQAVLLRCNPDRHEELARLPVITGKTWNHPAIAQNRLYLRSDAELACVELAAAPSE